MSSQWVPEKTWINEEILKTFINYPHDSSSSGISSPNCKFITWFDTGLQPPSKSVRRFFGPKLHTPKLFSLPSETCLLSSSTHSGMSAMKAAKWAWKRKYLHRAIIKFYINQSFASYVEINQLLLSWYGLKFYSTVPFTTMCDLTFSPIIFLSLIG